MIHFLLGLIGHIVCPIIILYDGFWLCIACYAMYDLQSIKRKLKKARVSIEVYKHKHQFVYNAIFESIVTHAFIVAVALIGLVKL